jgi:hypothetical protein
VCCKLWTKSTTVTLGGYISATTQDSFVNSGMFGFLGDRKQARRIDVYIATRRHFRTRFGPARVGRPEGTRKC